MGKGLTFLKPGVLNVPATLVFLFLPLLREQYQGGLYVAYYRPIDIISLSVNKPVQYGLLAVMFFILIIFYILVSAVIKGLPLVFKRIKTLQDSTRKYTDRRGLW